MCDSTKKKGRPKLRFASVSELKIVRIQHDAEPENTKEATKFSLKVFKGQERLQFSTKS